METAVKAIIIKDGEFLLLKQRVGGRGWYSLPGGRINSRDLEAELIREVKEETNLVVQVDKYIGD
jgi:8-oxo-dGTP diphosphatase